jgi:hypothetical protein
MEQYGKYVGREEANKRFSMLGSMEWMVKQATFLPRFWVYDVMLASGVIAIKMKIYLALVRNLFLRLLFNHSFIDEMQSLHAMQSRQGSTVLRSNRNDNGVVRASPT